MREGVRGRARAWAELLRLPATLTVPGDALAGAAAAGRGAGRGTLLAAGASLCLYEAGMALNDWADREEDAKERPERPLPSGRIAPGAALAAAAGLTGAGLALAKSAGRPALSVATALAGTVWAYDLKLKHTRWGPASMATARALDLLLGATAGAERPWQAARVAFPAAGLLGAHTLTVTAVSRHEVHGGDRLVPLAALAATATVAAKAGRPAGVGAKPTPTQTLGGLAAAAVSAWTAGRPLAEAIRTPGGAEMRRAVGGGIQAMIPLQAALAARAGRPGTAVPLLALLPVARRLSRRVSPT
jgi:4-hydroxybenzoate polyprenyltransferase